MLQVVDKKGARIFAYLPCCMQGRLPDRGTHRGIRLVEGRLTSFPAAQYHHL